MTVKKRESASRAIAFQILLELEKKRSNSALLLQTHLAKVREARDRNLITDLVLGTVRWKGRLTYVINSFSSRPVERLDAGVRVILQLGAYQLMYSRIPAHAAIHDTVQLCRKARLTSASGLVNAVLRRIQREVQHLPEPSGDEFEVASIHYSHPLWMVKRWVSQFGHEDTRHLMETNNRPPCVHIRVNELHFTIDEVRVHLEAEGVLTESTPFSNAVLQVTEGAPQMTGAFQRGEFYIQDPASEILGALIEPRPGMRILEIAAAPGGKTVQMATRMNDQGTIVSLDSEMRRMKLWQSNMTRLRIRSATAVIADALTIPIQSTFDSVVIDAPCSSMGVIRRHPEVKWWRSPEDLPRFAAAQLKILDACAKYVRSQGELIYSVCSFEPEETGEIIDSFLASQTEFRVIRTRYLYPHKDRTDGFFIAKLRRQ